MGKPMMVTSANSKFSTTLGVWSRANKVGKYAQYTPQKARMAMYRPKVCAAVEPNSGSLSDTAAKNKVAQAHARDETAETLPRKDESGVSG